jgi:hypothetical protein
MRNTFYFLAALGFELRASRLLAGVLPLAAPPALFCSGYLGDRVSLFAQAHLDLDPPILCLSSSLG